MDENYVHEGMNIHRREELKKRLIEHHANPDTLKLEKVVFDEMVGEGDKLAVWQTNHMSNGEARVVVTFHEFRNGKLLHSRTI